MGAEDFTGLSARGCEPERRRRMKIWKIWKPEGSGGVKILQPAISIEIKAGLDEQGDVIIVLAIDGQEVFMIPSEAQQMIDGLLEAIARFA
jgi:hypothetical protein